MGWGSGERVGAQVADDDQIGVGCIAFPDNQPVVGPVADRYAPQAVAEGAAPHRGAARIGLQRIDRVIDGVQ